MRNDASTDWLLVENLATLDALVGRYITAENPDVHWEDSYAHMRFESADEGLEALRDPYFQQFIPAQVRAETVLQEVRVFSPYSTNVDAAWEAVKMLATPRLQLRLWRDRDSWCAAFGEMVPSIGATMPVAICLAALRAKGLEIVLLPESDDSGPNISVA